MNRTLVLLAMLVSSFVSGQEEGADISGSLLVTPAGIGKPGLEEYRRAIRVHDKRPSREEIETRFQAQGLYKGTFLESRPDADRVLMLDIALAFFEDDPRPRGRLEKFADLLDSSDYKVTSWSGFVTSITASKDGKYRMVMEVRPDIVARGGGVAFTPKTCIEYWEWDGKKLALIKVESTTKGLDAVFVD